MLVWLSVWSKVKTYIWPSWCHCHSLSLASLKSRLVLPLWYRLTRVVLEKWPLNGCMCVSLLLVVFRWISKGCSIKKGWGRRVTSSGWSYCFIFSSVLWHCRFCESRGISPVKTCWNYPVHHLHYVVWLKTVWQCLVNSELLFAVECDSETFHGSFDHSNFMYRAVAHVAYKFAHLSLYEMLNTVKILLLCHKLITLV